MKQMARFLLPVAMSSAFSWNAWPGDDLRSSSRRISLVEFPVSSTLRIEAPAATAPELDEEPEARRSPTRPYAYGNVAAGRCNHGYSIFGGGGGGEAFPIGRLGIGGDLGYYQFVDDVSFGLFSANVALHLGDRSETARADPYFSVSPGFYTAGENGSGASFGLGGGFNYWFGERIGLHTDLRFAALGTEEAVTLFRVGVAFH